MGSNSVQIAVNGPRQNFICDPINCSSAPPPYLSLLLVKVSNGVDQGVGPQDDAGALGPLRAHQAVLSQQDLTDVVCTCHPDDGLPQEVGLKHVTMTFSARDVEV